MMMFAAHHRQPWPKGLVAIGQERSDDGVDQQPDPPEHNLTERLTRSTPPVTQYLPFNRVSPIVRQPAGDHRPDRRVAETQARGGRPCGTGPESPDPGQTVASPRASR